MDGLQLVVVVLLVITAVCTVGQEDYKINVNNMDNDITAECVHRNGLETPVVNPSWYLNGATIGENPCLNPSTLNGNELSFTITPDCEGYLQCSSGYRCSLPQRVYAYPTLSTIGSIERTAVPGSDVVLPCYLTVSAFNNFEVCWSFFMNGNRMEISCTTGSDYSLRLPMVNSSRIGTYQCKATANATSGSHLQPHNPSLTKLGPNIELSIFEPVNLTGEIEASFQSGMYQFSAPSARGTPPYTYKWFINNAEDPTTDSTLTIPLASNLLTTVMVSVSNHQDQTFTENRTAILVNSMMMCPTISPTNVPVSPVTQDTIVPAVLLGVFMVLGFLAIFILLFITLCLYKRLEVQKKTMQQNLTSQEELEKSNREQKEKSQLQISEQKEKFERLSEQKENFECQISEQKENFERQISEQKENFERQISELKRNLQREISSASDVDGYSDNQQQRPSKQQEPSGTDVAVKVIQQALVEAKHTERTHKQLPRFYLEFIISVLEKAKPILHLEAKDRTTTECTAIYECVKKMAGLAQKVAYPEIEPRIIQDDGGDDKDVLNERAELLKQIGLLKDLLPEFHCFTTTSC